MHSQNFLVVAAAAAIAASPFYVCFWVRLDDLAGRWRQSSKGGNHCTDSVRAGGIERVGMNKGAARRRGGPRRSIDSSSHMTDCEGGRRRKRGRKGGRGGYGKGGDGEGRTRPCGTAFDCIIYSLSLFVCPSFLFSLPDALPDRSERVSGLANEGGRDPGIPFPSSPSLAISLVLFFLRCQNATMA